MTRLSLPGCCFSKENVNRFRQAKFSAQIHPACHALIQSARWPWRWRLLNYDRNSTLVQFLVDCIPCCRQNFVSWKLNTSTVFQLGFVAAEDLRFPSFVFALCLHGFCDLVERNVYIQVGMRGLPTKNDGSCRQLRDANIQHSDCQKGQHAQPPPPFLFSKVHLCIPVTRTMAKSVRLTPRCAGGPAGR